MMAFLFQSVRKPWVRLTSRWLFPAGLTALAVGFLNDYLSGNFSLLLTGAAAVYAAAKPVQPRPSYRYANAALLLLAVGFLVPVKTVLWAAVAAAVFFWMEGQGFSVGFLGLAAFFFSSPAFQYAAAVFSFPLRLRLAEAIGTLFSTVNANVKVRSNTIQYSGGEFGVDPACAGLYMLSVSLLAGICLLGLLQRRTGRAVSLKAAVAYLLLLFGLNVFANAVRIVLLIQFAVPPENFMHDVIGLMCLLLYVCVPSFYLAKWAVTKAKAVEKRIAASPVRTAGFTQPLLYVMLLATGIRVASVDTYTQFSGKEKIAVQGYTASVYAPGILKLEDAASLVYVKFIRGFYDTDHNPTMCWKGSGYELADVRLQPVAQQEVYTAVLRKEEEKLYTAWWYGNGRHCTVDQTEWRWRMASTGSEYAVINVTAESQNALLEKVQAMMKEGTLNVLFKQ